MPNMDAPRKAYRFFLKHYRDGSTFTVADLSAATGWTGQTPTTYIRKKWADFLERQDDGSYRVKVEFRRLTEEVFLQHFSQKTPIFGRYIRRRYESVISYEFLLPLARELELRTILDELFYRDSIENRLREIGVSEIEGWFDRDPAIGDDEFIALVGARIGEMFTGYSVSHYSGRFRVGSLRTRADAAELLKDYERYLTDETTASVRFVMRVDESKAESFGTPGAPVGEEAIDRVRSIFIQLFAEAVVRTVKEEDEIWLLEASDFGTRLFVWEREEALQVE